MRPRHVICCAAILSAPIAPATLAAPAADGGLEQAVSAIQAQERAADYISMHGKLVRSRWDSKGSAWEPQGEQEINAVMENTPDGKFRVECLKELIPWRDGPAPFALSVYTMVYNGRIGGMVRTKYGKPGDKTQAGLLLAHLTPKPPPEYSEAVQSSGWVYSVFGVAQDRALLGGGKSQRFSSMLASLQGNPSLKVVNDDDANHHFLKVSVTDNKNPPVEKNIYWLDRDRGYALARREILKVYGDGLSVEKDIPSVDSNSEVTEMSQPAPGVYYPQHVETGTTLYDALYKTHIPTQKAVIDISNVQVNDPAVSAATFKVRVPKGSQLEDEETGAVIPIQSDAEGQAVIIRENEKKVVKMLEEGPPEPLTTAPAPSPR
jgi:hypothetical protein